MKRRSVIPFSRLAVLKAAAILLAVALLASLSAGCNGDETPQADGGNGDGEGNASSPTAVLPEELPESFPIFSPSEVLFGASREQETTVFSSFAHWRTDASPTEVTEFYEQELNKEPWTILSTSALPDEGALIVFTSTAEEPSGTLTVSVNEEFGTLFTVAFGEEVAP